MKLNTEKIAYDVDGHELKVGDIVEIISSHWATHTAHAKIHNIFPLKRKIRLWYVYEKYMEGSLADGKDLKFIKNE